MKKNLLAIIFASFCAGTLSAQNIAWPEVTTEAKPGARWWWMGSAVDAANLTRKHSPKQGWARWKLLLSMGCRVMMQTKFSS